jgi:TPR repeat protein
MDVTAAREFSKQKSVVCLACSGLVELAVRGGSVREGSRRGAFGRMALLATLLIAASNAGPSPARADYADGVAAQHSVSLEAAIRLWRKAGWQDDDFLAEMKLGDIYANSSDTKYYDPVEAYVWYYLASRSDTTAFEFNGDNDRVSGFLNEARRHAVAQQSALIVDLDDSQRVNARDRITYILSCRGAKGYIELGQIHDTRSRHNDSDYWTDNSGRYGRRDEDLQMVGINSRSVMVPNDAAALAYFHLGESMGDPVAKIYLDGLEARLRDSELGRRIIEEQARKFRYWSQPLEYYPGGDNDSGVPYTDECRMTFDREHAIGLVEAGLPASEMRHALAFLGWGHGEPKGIARFQLTLAEEPTGKLTAAQAVRLIKTAAVRGDAQAQNALGIMYAKGIGVGRNYVRAAYWFQKAADQRYGAALYHLGVLYKVGPDGIKQDLLRANDYFTSSAFAGFRPTLNQLKELLESAANAPPRPGQQ